MEGMKGKFIVYHEQENIDPCTGLLTQKIRVSNATRVPLADLTHKSKIQLTAMKHPATDSILANQDRTRKAAVLKSLR